MHAAPKAASVWRSDRCSQAPLALSLPAVNRLQTRPQFQAALAGSTVSRTPHFALHRLPLSGRHAVPQSPETGSVAPEAQALFAGAELWWGALVPKRWARRAVTRNTIKRQIYAVSLQFADRMPLGAHVVRLRAPFDRQAFPSATSEPLKQAVRQELNQLLERGLRA